MHACYCKSVAYQLLLYTELYKEIDYFSYLLGYSCRVHDPRHNNWRRGYMATESSTSGGGGTAPEAVSVAAAAAPSRVALHGVIGSFDPAQEEWCEYAERLTHYFVANDIAADEKKRAILLGDRKFR